MAWILTSDAVADLDRISAEGALRWGFERSERYELELADMFDQLAAMPHMAPVRQAARSEVRLMPCGSHHVVYVVDNEDVVILRVLHGLQDWFELL